MTRVCPACRGTLVNPYGDECGMCGGAGVVEGEALRESVPWGLVLLAAGLLVLLAIVLLGHPST